MLIVLSLGRRFVVIVEDFANTLQVGGKWRLLVLQYVLRTDHLHRSKRVSIVHTTYIDFNALDKLCELQSC
jgi:hypothetical protein